MSTNSLDNNVTRKTFLVIVMIICFSLELQGAPKISMSKKYLSKKCTCILNTKFCF